MIYDFNGTKIKLKERVCQLWDYIPGEIAPQLNLYVRLNNSCNANCKFCEYHGKEKEFDFNKFEKALVELVNRDVLGKIQITGGETSLDIERLSKIVEIIRKHCKDTFVSINTNGFDLLTLAQVSDKVDNYAISRHHYLDTKNREIFGTLTVPTANQLKAFIKIVGSDKVHISCNLMDSAIGNIEEVKNFLEFCSSIGCEDVGFVTLMDANEFCVKERVLFDNLGLEESDEFLKYKQYIKEGNKCRCANYIYNCRNTCKLIDLYGRFVCEKDDTPGIVCFDLDKLRVGFSGEEIQV